MSTRPSSSEGARAAPPRRADAGAPASLAERLALARATTEALCAPLATEDYVVQSMPDASPAKWHLGHTTWFFETFVLSAHQPGFAPWREAWQPLFNSYYVAAGPRHPRGERGLLTRPTVDEVYAWRARVDDQLQAFLAEPSGQRPEVTALVELGLNHEQQHQELLLTDLLHAFSRNPLAPAYLAVPVPRSVASPLAWTPHPGGLATIGHRGEAFAFDNESPAHRVFLEPFSLASRPVSCGEWAEFVADGGYHRPELWLSDGIAAAQAGGWEAPPSWSRRDGGWWQFTLHGDLPVDPAAPVTQVSFYEADAFARWAGARLPTEAEWEVAAAGAPVAGQLAEDGVLTAVAGAGAASIFGGAWVWTASPYVAYPGFQPAAGAVGEYNGKFMVNQLVLRGGSCLTPRGHVRASYRNFFPPHARWQMSGVRLAR